MTLFFVQGYTYILTHPGIPTVFYDHFYDLGDSIHEQIVKLVCYATIFMCYCSMVFFFPSKYFPWHADGHSKAWRYSQPLICTSSGSPEQPLFRNYWWKSMHEDWRWFMVSNWQRVDTSYLRTKVCSMGEIRKEMIHHVPPFNPCIYVPGDGCCH